MKLSKILFPTIATIAIGAMTFVACKKQNIEENKKSFDSPALADINYNQWGQAHNDALSLSEYYWADAVSYDFTTLVTTMAEEMDAQYPEDGFDEITSQEISGAVNSTLFNNMLGVHNMTATQGTTFYRNMLSDMLSTGAISQELHDDLYDIVDVSLSYEDCLSAINSVNQSNYTSSDIEIFTAFKSIVESSHDYWSNWETNHPENTARQISNGQLTIIADAIAGAGFFAAGPLGILIAGAISLGVSD
ncbi:MAG: hypothetical protein H6550_03000 [Chitinophagales bacterium]|nr:hypothetical protein [Chitinophagales bacterium]